MTRIFMLRHGETEWNTQCRLQGCKDSPLTANGVKQAENLRKYLDDFPIDICYSSPLHRAYKTARIALAGKTCPIICLEELKELNLGIWEGQNIEKLAADYKEEYTRFLQGVCGAEAAGGESLPHLSERICAALQKIARTHPQENVAVVSHGMILRTALCALSGKPLNTRTFKQSNGSVNIAEYVDGKWNITLQNHVPFGETTLKYSGNAAIFQ